MHPTCTQRLFGQLLAHRTNALTLDSFVKRADAVGEYWCTLDSPQSKSLQTLELGVGELKFGEFNLEVSSPIAKVETEEANAASEYEKTTQVNSKTMMDKAVAEVTSDKDTTSTELNAVLKDAYIEQPEDKDDTGDKSDVPPVVVKYGTGTLATWSLLC